MERGVTINDLTEEERALCDRLLAGNAALDEGMRLYALMTARAQTFPLAWEELVLGLAIAAHPDRGVSRRERHGGHGCGVPANL